jgi:hypothetical protein
MGAALTYARRYALFTLVGIAGEDDVDAPDLLTPDQNTSVPPTAKPNGDARPKGPLHAPQASIRGSTQATPQTAAVRRERGRLAIVTMPTLGAEASAQLTARLLAEIAKLANGDDAALWAQRCLPEKNTLIAADALRVEKAFQTKLAGLCGPPAPVTSSSRPAFAETARRAAAETAPPSKSVE